MENRDILQNEQTYLGFNSYQSREPEAINSSICLSMLGYNLLTHLFINIFREKKIINRKEYLEIFSTKSIIRNKI